MMEEAPVPTVDVTAQAHLHPPCSISVVVRGDAAVVASRSDHVGRETQAA